MSISFDIPPGTTLFPCVYFSSPSLHSSLEISLLLCSTYLSYTTLGVDNLAFDLFFSFFPPFQLLFDACTKHIPCFPLWRSRFCNLHCIMCPCTKAKISLKSHVTLTRFLHQTESPFACAIIALEVYVTLGLFAPYWGTRPVVQKDIKQMHVFI